MGEEIVKAEENIAAVQAVIAAKSDWDQFWGYGSDFNDLDTYEEKLRELQKAEEANEATIASIEQQWAVLDQATLEAANAPRTYEEAVSEAILSVQTDMDELCAAYDEAYASARSSIDGQIGLFDNMKTETELSVTDMEKAFESQIAYLTTYTENLQKAVEYGFDDALISKLSDGSTESAGQLDAIIEKVEKLGSGSNAAKEFVEGFNTKFQETETAKDEFAETVGKMETDFDEKMGEIEGRLDTAIENMTMDDAARTAAETTIDAYTQAILDGTSGAVSAAENAAAVANALETPGPTTLDSNVGTASPTGATPASSTSKGVSTNTAMRTMGYLERQYAGISGNDISSGLSYLGYVGHADGTTFAQEDAYIAGEEGPELILGARGSTVFPTSETDRLIDALSERRSVNVPYPSNEGGGQESVNAEQIRKVLVEIAGSGEIKVNGRMDEEAVLELLIANLKPALISIIRGEIFEEGDGTYDF